MHTDFLLNWIDIELESHRMSTSIALIRIDSHRCASIGIDPISFRTWIESSRLKTKNVSTRLSCFCITFALTSHRVWVSHSYRLRSHRLALVSDKFESIKRRYRFVSSRLALPLHRLVSISCRWLLLCVSESSITLCFRNDIYACDLPWSFGICAGLITWQNNVTVNVFSLYNLSFYLFRLAEGSPQSEGKGKTMSKQRQSEGKAKANHRKNECKAKPKPGSAQDESPRQAERYLGPSWAMTGPSWDHFGVSWSILGASLGQF